MGKFRGHQDKSRRGREKKLLKKKAAAAGAGSALAGSFGAEGTGDGGKKRKSTKHVTYSKDHSVLICGDGDFSFTRGVIRHRGTGAGVVATSLDSRKGVLKKYPRAESWLAKLDADRAQVVHSVDATRLEDTLLGAAQEGGKTREGGDGDGESKRVLFDRVVFNFPHTGKQRTHLNRNLIRDFFASTRGLVKCAAAGGEVHVTLKDKPPYSGWNVKAMAKESELVMVRCLTFDPSVFPGYRHSTTDPQAKEFDAGGAKTHVFCRARTALDDEVDESGAFPMIVTSMEEKPTTASVDKPASLATNAGDAEGKVTAAEPDNGNEEGLFGGGWAEVDGGDWEVSDGDGTEKEAAAALGAAAEGVDASEGVPRTSKDVNKGGAKDVPTEPNNKSSKKKIQRKKKKGVAAAASTAGAVVVAEGGNDAGIEQEHGGDSHLDGDGEKDRGDDQANERGNLLPPLVKKKAAKRRAQRKKAGEAAKAARAEAAGETGTLESKAVNAQGGKRGRGGSDVAASSKGQAKRNRGKYVARRKSGEQEQQGDGGGGGRGSNGFPKRLKM